MRAKALKDAPVKVTVVDRRNHHLFQPMLYQVATAALNPSDIASPIRSILRDSRNTEVILAEVKAVDVEAREVQLTDGTSLKYDYLLVATGARHSYFGHDEWERLAPGLKSLDDALEIRRRILLAFERAERETDTVRRHAFLTFVVVGGGPTGVEMAGAVGGDPAFCPPSRFQAHRSARSHGAPARRRTPPPDGLSTEPRRARPSSS